MGWEEWDEMGWNVTECDEMKRDKIEWDGKEWGTWNGIGQNGVHRMG